MSQQGGGAAVEEVAQLLGLLEVSSQGQVADYQESRVQEVVKQFLELFDSIRLVADDDEYHPKGRQALAASVRKSFVETGRRITMVLPAFPAKSPSERKVLGILPDRGEELAFQQLESFCVEVEKFYPPGAEVVIFSDGRVFSDLLYIPEERVAAYSQECKRMVADAGHIHIRFDNLENHLSMMSEEGSCIHQASLIEQLLYRYGGPEQGPSLEHDVGLHKVYMAIKFFLRLDLEPSKDTLLSGTGVPGNTNTLVGEITSKKKGKAAFKQKCGEVAKSMMVRNMAFSNLVDQAYPEVVRISIHAHSNAGPKYGVGLIPEDKKRTPHTPWHTVIVEDAEGHVQAMRKELVDMSEFEMYEHPVYKRPWGFKEKGSTCKAKTTSTERTDNLMRSEAGAVQLVTGSDLATLANLPVEMKPLQPSGLLLLCKEPALLTPFDIPSDTLRHLTSQFGVVVLRGFQEEVFARDQLVEMAAHFGRIVHWTFGAVMDVKEAKQASGKDALPMHWDGIFKFHNSKGEEIDHGDVPGFVLFHCVTPPVGCLEGGETLLTDTRRVVRSSMDTKQLSMLSDLEAEYYIPSSGLSQLVFGRWVKQKLIQAHPSTGEATIRYQEPWSEAQSAKQPVLMRATDENQAEMLEEGTSFVRKLIYNEDLFCYKHKWMANDLVLVDNHAILHARTSFTMASDRHLRRIHYN